MSNDTTTPKEPDIAWALWTDDGPITTAEEAVAFAESTGFAILPRQHEGEGVWLCDTDATMAADLREAGWLGIENGPFSAEAEWPV
jgi:hypothetical protein